MSVKIGAFQEQILNTLRQMRSDAQSAPKEASGDKASGGMSFADHLRQGIQEANGLSQKSDKLAVELATGKTDNVHETMLAASQAELSFNLMVQLRNKALEAYTEVMRMPV